GIEPAFAMADARPLDADLLLPETRLQVERERRAPRQRCSPLALMELRGELALLQPGLTIDARRAGRCGPVRRVDAREPEARAGRRQLPAGDSHRPRRTDRQLALEPAIAKQADLERIHAQHARFEYDASAQRSD